MNSQIPEYVIAGSEDGKPVIFKWNVDDQKFEKIAVAMKGFGEHIVERLNNSYSN